MTRYWGKAGVEPLRKGHGPDKWKPHPLTEASVESLPKHHYDPKLSQMTGREPERLQALIEFMEAALAQGLVEEACRARAGRTIENLRRQYNDLDSN